MRGAKLSGAFQCSLRRFLPHPHREKLPGLVPLLFGGLLDEMALTAQIAPKGNEPQYDKIKDTRSFKRQHTPACNALIAEVVSHVPPGELCRSSSRLAGQMWSPKTNSEEIRWAICILFT